MPRSPSGARRRVSRDLLESRIEAAPDPGRFVSERACSVFVRDLEEVEGVGRDPRGIAAWRVDRHRGTAALATGEDMIVSAVTEVVGGSRRHACELVARLVVGHAEALASCGVHGKEFVAGFRARYPRHVAFRRELDTLYSSSPALGRL